jgi:S-disulfanyl-L-cysteine oxidoreductase SoxD
MSKLLLLAGAVTALAVVSARGASVTGVSTQTIREAHREPSRSVWDSVYTDSQAVRGDSVYKETCVKCHGATLAGGDEGTPLTGANFLGNWNGLTVGELYEKVRTTMPPDKPKSIPPQQLADVVAYMLAKNLFPAGTKPLATDAEALKDIKIVGSKP